MTDSPPPPPEEPVPPPPADEPTATPAAPPPAPPQYTPPPAPPQYAPPQYPPPPGMPSQYAPYPTPMGPPRPGMVTGAGITMIVLGALIVLLGLFAVIAGVFVGGAANAINVQTPGFGNLAGAVAGVIIVFALILLAIGILDIVAGANVLGGRQWARITGIVLAVILALFGLGSVAGNGSGNGGGVIGILMLLANIFIVWALATTGGWFAARGR